MNPLFYATTPIPLLNSAEVANSSLQGIRYCLWQQWGISPLFFTVRTSERKRIS
jgi:hypothetical protein